MGRPRLIKFNNGEIVLKNLTPEECDAIQETLDRASGVSSLVRGPVVGDIVEVKPDEPIKVVDITELKETAVGLYHNKEKSEFHVVVLKYNPISGAAKVVEMKNSGNFKLAGVNNLKVELVNLGLI